MTIKVTDKVLGKMVRYTNERGLPQAVGGLAVITEVRERRACGI